MSPVAHLTTFRARLTLRWTLAVGLLLGAALAVVHAGADIYLQRWLDNDVRTLAATETASATDGPSGVHLHEGPFIQYEAGAFTEKLVQIFDERGRLLLQSSAAGNLAPVVGPDVVRAAIAGDAPLVSTEADGRPVRVAVLRAERDGVLYAVAVGLFADEVERALAALTWLLAIVWLVSLTATAAIGSALAARTLAPVARITERAAWIARGNFDGRLDTPTVDDELGRMTTLLNSMLDRLRGAIEANRRFASDASHELRGPLTAMAGEVDVALRHPRSADSYRETLENVRGGLASLTQLAEDLILLVRTQEGARDVTLRELPLDGLFADAFRRAAPAAAVRGITLEQDGLAGVHVYADAVLMARVLDNVVGNAVFYNRDAGHVRVTARLEEPPAGEWASPIVEIAVADTGAEIPEARREEIFERFVRLDESRARHSGGSGLGLAICREVLRLLGGTIRVGTSTPDGTTMLIRMPGRGAEPPADGSAPQGQPIARLSSSAARP